jgi:hypothetical protein
MKKVFISHSRDSALLAEKLSRALLERNFSTWLDTKDIRAGEKLTDAIDDALRQADAVLFLITADQQARPWNQYEWRTALKQSWSDPAKPMIPVLIGEAERPPFLRDRVAVRVGDGPGQWNLFIDRLVDLLEGSTSARDESGYADAQAEQQKALDELEKWALALETGEEYSRQSTSDPGRR